MRRLPFVPFAVVAAVALAKPLAAQWELRAGSVDGVAFRVPAEFTPAAGLSDRTTAVFEHAPTHDWVFVATLADPRSRAAVIRRIAGAIGGAALGAEGASAEWSGLPSDPTSPHEEYRQRLALHGRNQMLDITFRQYRAGGRAVVVGSAFVTDEQEGPGCGNVHNFTATLAEAQLGASVRGEPPVAPGPGGPGPPLVGGPPTQGGAPPSPSDPDVAAVTAAFHTFVKAVMEHDGAPVAEISAPAVVEHFARMRDLALYAAPAEVRALPLEERFMVLRLRHTMDAAKLQNMTARDVLATEIAAMESDGSAGGSQPLIEGDVATVQLTWNGKPSDNQLAFVRRGGRWNVDFLSMSASGACDLRRELRSAGVGPEDENGVLLLGLERLNGRAAAPTIWEPLLPPRAPR